VSFIFGIFNKHKDIQKTIVDDPSKPPKKQDDNKNYSPFKWILFLLMDKDKSYTIDFLIPKNFIFFKENTLEISIEDYLSCYFLLSELGIISAKDSKKIWIY
jgi:hypothetical protein